MENYIIKVMDSVYTNHSLELMIDLQHSFNSLSNTFH